MSFSILHYFTTDVYVYDCCVAFILTFQIHTLICTEVFRHEWTSRFVFVGYNFADGASDREKQSWTSVLNQVAIFSHHDNSYSLSPSYYNDVKEDWPFYAEDTRREVIRYPSYFYFLIDTDTLASRKHTATLSQDVFG